MHHFTLTEELDYLVYIGIVTESQNVVVGCTSFLLCYYFANATSEIPVYVNFILSAIRSFRVNDDFFNKYLN